MARLFWPGLLAIVIAAAAAQPAPATAPRSPEGRAAAPYQAPQQSREGLTLRVTGLAYQAEAGQLSIAVDCSGPGADMVFVEPTVLLGGEPATAENGHALIETTRLSFQPQPGEQIRSLSWVLTGVTERPANVSLRLAVSAWDEGDTERTSFIDPQDEPLNLEGAIRIDGHEVHVHAMRWWDEPVQVRVGDRVELRSDVVVLDVAIHEAREAERRKVGDRLMVQTFMGSFLYPDEEVEIDLHTHAPGLKGIRLVFPAEEPLPIRLNWTVYLQREESTEFAFDNLRVTDG